MRQRDADVGGAGCLVIVWCRAVMRGVLMPCSRCWRCPRCMREGGQLREVLWAGNVHSGGSRVAPELAGRQGCGCIAGKPSEGGRKSYVPVVQGQGQRGHRWQARSKEKEILCASRAGLCVLVRARQLLSVLARSKSLVTRDPMHRC